jgi:ZIP family zinc transporter
LFLIGIQTAFAVTLHKFPEGFITYVTSETNPQLGVTIFLSLLLHNFTEGFSICLPLYYSFANGVNRKYAKLKALAISAILVGLSQPLGALGGYLFLKMNNVNPGSDIDTSNLNFIFGVTMAITSGFLTVVALSMYGSAISFGGGINFAMIWCMMGMVLIGLSSIYAV